MSELTREEHLALLTAYGCKDAMVQGRVLPSLLESVKSYGAQAGFMSDCRLNPIVRDMGLLGFCQDKLQACRFSGRIKARMTAYAREMREISGRSKLNPRSSEQVADWLFGEQGLEPVLNPDKEDWEEGDTYSTSRDALFALEDHGVPDDVARFIRAKIKFGSLSTLLTTNVRRVFDMPAHPAFPDRYTWLQPSFRIETATSRLRSSPNVQNYTTRGFVNVRTLLVPPPEHVFVVIDSEQLELRLYAGESGDEYYTRAFLEGLDAHSLNVVSLLAKDGATEGEIMDLYHDFVARRKGKKGEKAAADAYKVRTLYKSVVFSMLYGAGWQKVFEILSRDCNKSTGERFFPGLKPSTIEQVYRRFKQVHPWLERWHQRVDNFVRAHGYVREDAGGRIFPYPEGASEPNAARNFTIQAAAAHKINQAMHDIASAYPFQSLSGWTGLVCQTHDEIVLCVPWDEAVQAAGVCEEAFRSEHKGIPLLGEPEISTRYAAGGETWSVEQWKRELDG